MFRKNTETAMAYVHLASSNMINLKSNVDECLL